MSLTGKPSYQTRRLGGDAIISDDTAVSEFSAWSSMKTAEEIANSGATVIDDTTDALDKTYSSTYLESRLAAVVPSPDRVVQCADPSATLRSILVCDDVGALMSTWADAKIGTDGSLILADGAGNPTAPCLKFDGDATTGLFLAGASSLGVAADGATVATFAPSGLTVPALTATTASINGGSINNASIGSSTRSTGAFTTLASNSTTTLGATTATSLDATPIGGTTRASAAVTTLSASGIVDVPAGAVGAPALRMAGDTTSGLYRPAADQIGFSTGGVSRGLITSTGLNACAIGATTRAAVNGTTGDFNSTLAATGATTLSSTLAVTGQTTVQLGTVSAPSVRGTGATTTGIYFPNTTSVAATVAGTQRLLVDANGTTSSGYSIDGVTRITTITGGAFTPTMTDTSGVQPTYLSQGGSWQQIGRIASCFIYLQVNAITAPLSTDQIRITLPFTTSAAGSIGAMQISLATPPANTIGVTFRAVAGQTYGVIDWVRGAGLATTPMTWSQFAATGYLSIQLTAYI